MSDMRLIDANDVKELLHDILGKEVQPFTWENDIDRMVDRLPTAYDIDKVVEEMKANAKKMSEAKFKFDVDGGHAYYKAIGTKKCEEIIRNGGR